jgi:citrate synthase
MIGPAGRFAARRAGESVAQALALAMGVAPDRGKVAALNAALVLVADHEFTPATFAARIAASVGCDLYSCVGTALQVQFGAGLGQRCDRVEQLLAGSTWRAQGIDDDSMLRATPASFGFSHPLYAAGDPRADLLLVLAQEIRGKKPPFPEKVEATRARQHLTLDEALVVFCRALGVAPHAAGGLLALGRAAGWIAHVFEQRQQGFWIRPRGKFITDAQTPAEGLNAD